MKRFLKFFTIATVFAMISVSLSVSALASADTSRLMNEAETLFNDRKGSLEDFEKSITLYKKVLSQKPENYEALWKCARSYRYYGDKSKVNKVDGWKKICASYGKEGMNYAQKAIDLKPDQPAGYYFYALSVGVYSDGVSIVTALKEGLKKKTQSSFEKLLELDKHFEDGSGMLGLGRFWAVLPWPLKNKKKALKYYRDYQATPYFGKEPEGYIYLSEVLIAMGGKKRKAEAKELLSKFNAPNPYFQEIKNKLLKKL